MNWNFHEGYARFLLILLLDIYIFIQLRKRINQGGLIPQRLIWSLAILYWLISLFGSAGITWIYYFRFFTRDPFWFSFYNYFVGAFVLLIVPKAVFFLSLVTEKLALLVRKLIHRSDRQVTRKKNSNGGWISKTGLILAIISLLIFGWGMTGGRFLFRVDRVEVPIKDLPASFDGFKIVQISDLHLGSLAGFRHRFEKAVDLINEQQPDIVVFTGDLLNNYAEEAWGWEELFGSINSRIGKYAILGNHDYGGYHVWQSRADQWRNLHDTRQFFVESGFRLLLNEVVWIERDSGEQIVFCGSENWGNPPYPQYGNLDKLLELAGDTPVKILLTHDPTHWEMEVKRKRPFDLTLSGHTHGMQLGIRQPAFRWSLAKLRYPYWSGLYRENDQFIHVNTGLGYIGFPGRVGMRPEITLIQLTREVTSE